MELVVSATSRPLYPRERPGTNCIGVWLGLRVGLEVYGNLASTGIRSPNCPCRSESLCGLQNPGPPYTMDINFYILWVRIHHSMQKDISLLKITDSLNVCVSLCLCVFLCLCLCLCLLLFRQIFTLSKNVRHMYVVEFIAFVLISIYQFLN